MEATGAWWASWDIGIKGGGLLEGEEVLGKRVELVGGETGFSHLQVRCGNCNFVICVFLNSRDGFGQPGFGQLVFGGAAYISQALL